jgi:hypothetical protein
MTSRTSSLKYDLAAGTPAYWSVFTDRVLDLWQRYDAIAKEKKQDSFFFANSGGNVPGGPNLDRLGKVAAWFQADNQGRSYEDAPVWGCSMWSARSFVPLEELVYRSYF